MIDLTDEDGPSKRADANIVIFGASGDLTRRKLVPALHSLACEGLLSPDTQVLGVARSSISDEEFRERLYSGVEEYSRHNPGICQLWDNFAPRHSYLQGGYDESQTYDKLEDRLRSFPTENVLFYLATPPTVVPSVVRNLRKQGLNVSESGFRRIVLEKPFGKDLDSACRLNDILHRAFEEDQIYRIDHYLGKETVQNIMTFRFANGIFEPLWNRDYIDHVQITMSEQIGVGNRARYYEGAGVFRDIFQNHLLQLLANVGMEPPYAFNQKALRDEKAKVLRGLRELELENCVRGQYRGYREEEGVAPDSTTATFGALKLFIDNWRWQGVPFYLRSGKNLARKSTEITLVFKATPHRLFPNNADLTSNRLSLCIQPDEGVRMLFETKVPKAGMRTTPVNMDFNYGDKFGPDALPDAYERLLLDAIEGDIALFARQDEIELAWEFLDPLLEELEKGREPQIYEPDSWGPEGAKRLIQEDGREWICACGDNPC